MSKTVRWCHTALAVALVGMMALAVTQVGAQPRTIRWGIYADPLRLQTAQEQVAAFKQENPGINVSVEAVPFAQYYDKLSTEVAAGSVYDVFMISGAYFSRIAPTGVFENLSPDIKESGIDLTKYTMDPENSTYRQQVYAMPYELDVQGLYYNKDAFDRAGVAYPTSGWTWNTLLDAARKLTNTDSSGKTTQWGFYAENLYPSWVSFIAQNGGSILNDNNKVCTMDQPAAVDALQFMVDLMYRYHVAPAPTALPQGADPFQAGLVAMRLDGSYSVRPALQFSSFHWGIAPLPTGKRRGAAYWTQGVAISSKSADKQDAWKFVAFLMSDRGQRVFARSKMATPSLRSVALSPDYLSAPPEGMGAFLADYAAGAPVPFMPNWFEIMRGSSSAIGAQMDLVWLNKERVQDAVQKICPAVNRLL